MTSKIETATVGAAEQVAGNNDLLEEILVRLPPKSVTRSKLVSKQWLSLITDAQFVHRHSQHGHTHRKFQTGIFVTDTRRICRSTDFVPFTDELNPTHQTIPSLGFLYDGIEPPDSEIEIIKSRNGLVLCAVSWDSEPFDYCVCNPTTKTFRMLGVKRKPEAWYSPEAFALLAFDPSVSHHYKVICNSTTDYFLLVYSSEDQSWKTIQCPYDSQPTTSDPSWTYLFILHHQYPTPDFRVCEMSSDLSQCVTKYNASVSPLLSAFPQISLVVRGNVSYCFKGMSVVEGAKQDELQLVLGIPGKLLLYNLKDKTAKEFYNLRSPRDGPYGYISIQAFQFTETLSVV